MRGYHRLDTLDRSYGGHAQVSVLMAYNNIDVVESWAEMPRMTCGGPSLRRGDGGDVALRLGQGALSPKLPQLEQL